MTTHAMRPTCTLLLLAILCCPRPALAEDVHWFADAGDAWRTAKKEKRPLLIYFTASDCHWCNEMRTKTLGDADVAKEISKSFVAVSVKGESDEELAETFDVKVYPTVVIVSPEKKVLARMVG